MLRERSFRRLFAARTTSILGTAIAPVALAFAVLDLPGAGATELGLVLFARELPQVVFLLFAGVIADRLPRYRVMVGADLAAGLAQAATAALFITGHASLGPVMALEAVNGAAFAFFLPASTGLVPQLVTPARLQSANALLRLSVNTSRIAGAGIAGVLVAGVGAGWALAGDAVSFLVSAVLLLGVRAAHPARAERTSMLADLRSGWREFASRQWVWVIVVQFAFVNACFTGGLLVLGPVVAERELGGAVGWSAILALDSAGLVVGSLLALRLRPRHPMRLATYATFGFVPPFVLLAVGAPVWLIGLSALLAGACSDVFGVLWETGLQTHVPQAALSRVSSYDALGSFALGPLGLAVVGPIAAVAGVEATLLGGAALVALASALALLSPEVRNLPARQPFVDPVAIAAASTNPE